MQQSAKHEQHVRRVAGRQADRTVQKKGRQGQEQVNRQMQTEKTVCLRYVGFNGLVSIFRYSHNFRTGSFRSDVCYSEILP
jgi:hypothetical protein